VDHYIFNPDCDALAFDFYYGQFKPSDNALSSEFMDLLLNENDALRPFYRWCFDRTIDMADGAFAEYIGTAARSYVEKYPVEFIEFTASDSLIMPRWAEIIAYSGMHEFQYELEGAGEKLAQTFIASCVKCEELENNQLDSFANLIVSLHENQ
jgi:hypothetical protein